MAKSLNGLIRHLLDQIALCGGQGASPSDFIKYVQDYYSDCRTDSLVTREDDQGANRLHVTPNIDRSFLDQVWKWLVKNSEIIVGNNVEFKSLTLSEAEERNSASNLRPKSDAKPSDSTNRQANASLQACSSVHESQHCQTAQVMDSAECADSEVTTRLHHMSDEVPAIRTIISPSQQDGGSETHSPQRRGSKNKKSKKPPPLTAGKTAGPTESTLSREIRLYTSEIRMWNALTGHGPDLRKVLPLEFDCLSIIARFGSQGILQHDLTRLTGQDKRSLPARTDRLHESGYIVKEQVSVREGNPPKLLHTSRCVLARLARFELDQKLKPYPSQADPKSAKKKKKLDPDRDQNSVQADKEIYPKVKPAPQWAADRSISNQIFGLVEESGSHGMSMTDIRDRLLGPGLRKFTEEHVSRLVESWQISQPLHLRHLAIVRDTMLKGKSQIYMHYSYRNFQKLVDEGRGFWEAVSTVPDHVIKGKNFAAALDARPDVDQFGFPKLDDQKFDGRRGKSKLGDVARALDAGPLPIGIKDPLLKIKADGTYAITYQPSGPRPTARGEKSERGRLASPSPRPSAVKLQTIKSPEQSNELHENLVAAASQSPDVAKQLYSPTRPSAGEKSLSYQTPITKRKYIRKSAVPLGRPRKYPKTGVPQNIKSMSAKEIKQMRDSQEMAEKYETKQIVSEIMRRVEDGEDSALVTGEVLAATDRFRQMRGEGALSEATKAQILFDFAGGPKPDPLTVAGSDWTSKLPPEMQSMVRRRTRRSAGRPYWPSMAAHTYPTHVPRSRPGTRSVLPDEKRVDETNRPEDWTRRKEKSFQNLKALSGEQSISDHSAVSVFQHVMCYLPSVAAHSRPNRNSAFEHATAPQKNITPKIGRPRRKVGSPVPRIPGLLSKASDLSSSTAPRVLQPPGLASKQQELPTQQALRGLKRRRGPSKTGLPFDNTQSLTPMVSPQFKYLPSISAHSGPFLPLYSPDHDEMDSRQRNLMNLMLLRSNDCLYPGWVVFMLKYYEPQLQSIKRPHDGLYLGDTLPRRKRPVEPKDLRPKKFKIIIFKLARLKECRWFVSNAEPSKVIRPHDNSKDRGAGLNNTANIAMDKYLTATTTSASTKANFPTSISEALKAVRPRNGDSLRHTEGKSTKRKREASPQLFRNPPPAPLTSECFSPEMVSSSVSEELHPLLIAADTVQAESTILPSDRASSAVMESSAVSEEPEIIISSPGHTPSQTMVSNHSTIAEPFIASEIASVVNSAVVHPVLTGLDGAMSELDDSLSSKDEGIQGASKVPGKVSKDAHPSIIDLTDGLCVDGLAIRNGNSPEISTPAVNTVHSGSPDDESSDKMISVAQTAHLPTSTSKIDISSPRHVKPPVTDLPKIASPKEKDYGNFRKSFGHMSRRGGSSAVLRKNIIMDLVDKCGGVFPNHREMSQPFAIEWYKKGQEGYPEPKTLQNAVTSLCTENKIRRITFIAETSQGLVVTKDLIALASIETTDPRVMELQRRMVAAHPRLYLPAAVMPVKAPPSSNTLKKGMMDQEGANASRSEPIYPLQTKSTRRQRRRRNSQGQLVEIAAGSRNPVSNNAGPPRIPSRFHSGFTGNSNGSRGKVQRLATLQGFPNIAAIRSSLGPRQETPSNGTAALTWLSPEYAFSELNFEEERPTILEPSMVGDTRNRYARYGARMDTPRAIGASYIEEQAKRRMRERAMNAAKIERHQARLKPIGSSQLYSDLSINVRNLHTSSHKPALLARSTSVDSSLSGDADSEDFGSSPTMAISSNRKPDVNMSVPSHSVRHQALNGKQTVFEKIHEFRIYCRSLLVGFMDPVHHFNKQNGTFSVTFAGLHPPRKILGQRGTCSYPYRANLKAVHPVDGRKYNALLGAAGPHDFAQPLQQTFAKEVDSLLSWELSTEGLQNAVIKGWSFIRYNFPHNLITAETIAKGLRVDFDHARPTSRSVQKGRGKDGRGFHSKGKIVVSSVRDHAVNTDPSTLLKHRRLLSVPQKRAIDQTTDSESRPIKYRRMRGPRSARHLDQNDEQRLLMAVMVIRTLTGGIEKHIDWILVAKVFEPERDQMFIHSRYNYVQSKYALLLPKLESDFQNLFTRAYEMGDVPVIDFENLHAYDWKWLVEWAMEKVDTAFQSQPELPAERKRYEDLYTTKTTYNVDNSEYYEFDRASNTLRRTIAVSRSAYVVPLKQDSKVSQPEEAEKLSIAMTWVRANIITPKETYDPTAARAKLSIFPEEVIENALKQLLVDKILIQENKGRLVPGRNYDVSGFYLDRLRKRLLSAHFQRAAQFKTQLDQAFDERGHHPYSYSADDGDVLAIFNLVSNKSITVVPLNVPLNKWGLTDGGYESRHINKKRLKFDVELRPLAGYAAGNPLSPLPPPPCQHLEDPDAKIPTWYDIHGSLVPLMWNIALAAVLSILALRPGAGSAEIENSVSPAMQAWEIELLLDWLVAARAAKREGTGYSVEEWWWLALGNNEELAASNMAMAKGKGKERAIDAVNDDTNKGGLA